jgi:N-methylhydantoinase B
MNIRAVEAKPAVDPITAEIINHGIAAIPNLIDKNITRTAFSPLVAEYKDYAVGMVDAEGRLITQSRGGLPVFCANALSVGVRDGLRLYGKARLQHGDIVISNHAATMGQHLNNVVMYTPIRTSEDDAGLFGFMANRVHWVDVGGIVVGSCLSSETRDVFQEGIQYHTVKLPLAGRAGRGNLPHHQGQHALPRSRDGRPGIAGGRMPHGPRYGAGYHPQARDGQGAPVGRGVLGSVRSGRAQGNQRHSGRDLRASSFLDNDGINIDRTIPVEVAVHVAGDEITIDLSALAHRSMGR